MDPSAAIEMGPTTMIPARTYHVQANVADYVERITALASDASGLMAGRFELVTDGPFSRTLENGRRLSEYFGPAPNYITLHMFKK